MKEVPDVNAFYARNKGKVNVLGVDIQESKAKVTAFAEKQGITYPVALDTDGKVAGLYQIRGIPSIIAIGEDGAVLFRGHGIKEMEKKVSF